MGEYLARALKIGNQGDPFVLRFLDALHDYSAKQVNRLEAFMARMGAKKGRLEYLSTTGNGCD